MQELSWFNGTHSMNSIVIQIASFFCRSRSTRQLSSRFQLILNGFHTFEVFADASIFSRLGRDCHAVSKYSSITTESQQADEHVVQSQLTSGHPEC